MTKPDYLDELINAASTAAGSDYKVAKMIGTTGQRISDWRKGRQLCPVADQVLLAELAGLEPEQWLVRATLAKYEGTKKGEQLFKALGKALLATGGAIASSGANAHPIFSHSGIETVSNFIRCIVLLSKERSYPRIRIRQFFNNTCPL